MRVRGIRFQASGVRRELACLTPLLITLVFAAQTACCFAADAAKPEKPYTTQPLRGKVVWMADALKRRFNLKSDDDAAHAVAALETADGELWPVLKDARGRAFYRDERLREIDVELLVRRYEGSPMVQVVRIYTLKPEGKYELDYWCDVCSIAMYELKQCECCQGPIRLRQRLVEKRGGER